MIVDNKYALVHAERIVRNAKGDTAVLIREISGELMRFNALGKFAIMATIEAAIDVAKKSEL